MTTKHDSIQKAIAACAAEVPVVERDATGDLGNRSYKYATLASMVRAIQPVMAKHGLGVVQPPIQRIVDNQVHAGCRTILLHESGGQVESELVLPIQGSGNALQQIGSTISYVRRYTYPFAVVDDESDDDGRGAGAPQGAPSGPRGQQQRQPRDPASPITEKQLGRLMAKVRKAAQGDIELMETVAAQAKSAVGYPQDSSVKHMPKGIYEGFCDFVDAWQPEAPAAPAPEEESQEPIFPDDVPTHTGEGHMTDEEIEAAFGDEVPHD